MRKEKKEDNTVEIVEDVRIPNTDIILEAGDKIRLIEMEKIYLTIRTDALIDADQIKKLSRKTKTKLNYVGSKFSGNFQKFELYAYDREAFEEFIPMVMKLFSSENITWKMTKSKITGKWRDEGRMENNSITFSLENINDLNIIL